MKRISILIAAALIISILILSSVATAATYTCLICGSNDVQQYAKTTTIDGPDDKNCKVTHVDLWRRCANCNHSWDVEPDPQPVPDPHSFTYQDMGCSNNVHAWKKICTKCGWYSTFRITCPGPPYCVYPD